MAIAIEENIRVFASLFICKFFCPFVYMEVRLPLYFFIVTETHTHIKDIEDIFMPLQIVSLEARFPLPTYAHTFLSFIMGLTLHGLIHNAIHSCMIPFFSSKPPNHDSTDSELHNTDQETSIPDHPPSVEPKHPPQIVSIDDILKNWAGEFGKSQALHFTISSFAWALEALHTLVVVFADKNPSWRCITNANPMAAHSSPILCGGSMHMSSICSMDRSLWEWTHGKSESTVSEWDLICGNTYKKGLAQSSFFIGCLIGKTKLNEGHKMNFFFLFCYVFI